MFGHLIESTSHTGEFTRRGYFIVLTAVCYGVLIMAGTVASVFAYDAHLETQEIAFVTMINPNLPEVQPVKQNEPRPAQHQADQTPIRVAPIAQLANSTKVPDKISTEPMKGAEVPNVPFRIGDRDFTPVTGSGPIGPAGPGDGGPGTAGPIVEDTTTPPDPVKPRPTMISKGVITGQAISLPKPDYPAVARQMRLSGSVKVQVLIDETGNVVSAQVIDGPPMLRRGAEQAARQARFKPTMLSDGPVKVSGYIVYNFNFSQ